MKIAVDFDGTIVRHAYPKIGKAIPFALETLRMLQKKHQLILWTIREGALLEEAVVYCRSNGIEFYAVNANYRDEELYPMSGCRKVNADVFIDDRNFGGLPDWGLIYQVIECGVDQEYCMEQGLTQPRSRRMKGKWWYRLFFRFKW